MRKLLSILIVLFFWLSANSQTIPPGTTYTLPYNNVVAKPPNGISIFQAAKGWFTDTLFLNNKLKFSTGTNNYVLTSDANGNISLQPASGGGGTPAGNFGNLQINRFGAFATPATDSLTFDANGLHNLSNFFTGPIVVGSTAWMQLGQDNFAAAAKPLLLVGPLPPANANNNWVEIRPVDTITTFSSAKIIGTSIGRNMYVKTNNLTSSFHYGAAAGWNIFLPDSFRFNNQNNDGNAGLNSGIGYNKFPGQTGRSAILTGATAYDHSAGSFSQIGFYGGSATNNYRLHGWTSAYTAFIFSDNAGGTDSVDNFTAFFAGGGAVGLSPKINQYRAFLSTASGGTGANILGKYYSLYGTKGSSKAVNAFNEGGLRLGGSSASNALGDNGDDTTRFGSILDIDGSIVIRDGTQSNGYVLTSDANGKGSWQPTASSGSPNSNIGSGYRWAIPNTNNIKTFFTNTTLGLDSSSNTNALTLKVDTVVMATRLRVQKGIDSLGALIGGGGWGYAGTIATLTGDGVVDYNGHILGLKGITKIQGEDVPLSFYNGAGTSLNGRIGRNSSDGGLSITADAGNLTFYTGGSAGNITIATSNSSTSFRVGTVAGSYFGANVTTAPAASAIVEIASTTQGFLPPRMTATQASAISSPAEGLIVYVTNTNGTFTVKGMWYFDGANWIQM